MKLMKLSLDTKIGYVDLGLILWNGFATLITAR